MPVITYAIEPNPVWQFLDLNGLPASGGYIYTWEAANHSVPKSVFQDQAGATPWTNPIVLDASGKQSFDGTCYPIFWADDAPYYIQILDSDMNVIMDMNNYPDVTNGSIVVNTSGIVNFAINGQFNFDFGQIINATGKIGFYEPYNGGNPLLIAPGPYYFQKSNNSVTTDSIIFIPFVAGETSVPSNPYNSLNYNCPAIGAGETLKKLWFQLNNARMFNGETITIQFQAASLYNNAINVAVEQQWVGHLISTPVATAACTPAYALFNFTVAVPSLEATGIVGDGQFRLVFDLPLNALCDFSVTNIWIQKGSDFIVYQEDNTNITEIDATAQQYPMVTSVNPADGYYDVTLAQGDLNFSLIPRAGIEQYWPLDYPPDYALIENGLPIYSANYYNLCNVLWDINQNILPHGCGPQSIQAVVSTATVTGTWFSYGVVVAGSAGNSPFTYTQVALGTSDTQGSFTILAVAASAVLPAQYFLINGPTIGTIVPTSYYCWLSLNNQTVDPITYTSALAGKIGIKVVYQGSETAEQLAALISFQLNVAQVRVPDARGLFFRGRNAGATAVFPDLSQLTLTATTDMTAVSFAIIGLDVNGAPLTETLAGPNNNTVTSIGYFSAITSLTPSVTITDATFSAGGDGVPAGLVPANFPTGVTSYLLAVAIPLVGIFQRDPDYTARTALYDEGSIADHVPSFQINNNKAHAHPNGPGQGNYLTNGGGNEYEPSGSGRLQNFPSTGYSGGNQANPNNVYRSVIIYI